MANWAEEAFAPVEAYNRNIVKQQTWGHLACKKNKVYKGWILFGVSCYQSGSIMILDAEFKDLDDSPWFYEAMYDYVYSLKLAEGAAYRFDGNVKNYAFTGTVTTLTHTPKP